MFRKNRVENSENTTTDPVDSSKSVRRKVLRGARETAIFAGPTVTFAAMAWFKLGAVIPAALIWYSPKTAIQVGVAVQQPLLNTFKGKGRAQAPQQAPRNGGQPTDTPII